MKNYILTFLCYLIYNTSVAQNTNYSIDKYQKSIIDTVSQLNTNQYYLVSKNTVNTPHFSVVKKVDDLTLIIKSHRYLDLDFGKKLYLLDDSWKLSNRILQKLAEPLDQSIFSIKVSRNSNLDFLTKKNNIDTLRYISSSNIVLIKTSLAVIREELIHNSVIEYIDVISETAKEESPLRQYNPDINRISTAKHNYQNLTGEGIIVSLKENSINEGDIDLLNKVTVDENSSTEMTQHAKEMGTLIAGLGNSHKTGEGVAVGSSLICTDFSSLFAEENSYYNQHGVTVQNHSYGTGIENFYGNESISYDQIVIDNPNLVHVFSAGNAGAMAPEFGTYAGIEGYANLTGDFKQAKNILVIAALDSTLNHVGLTSSGPAYDGRVKPELAAFGGEGTSESAALVSGSVAMIQTHFEDLTGSLPSSSLVKSVLIAGANEAHKKGIDFRTGYGSLNLNRSIQLINSESYVEGLLNANDAFSYQLKIPANAAELKVVVSWIDPPANPEDAKALVNDLDMIVTAPDNGLWLPWVLDASPNAINLASFPTRKEDHLNNVEMITIENPIEGIFNIEVKSNQLQGANQAFSIAYAFKQKDVFEWSYPTSSDHLEAATTTYLRWENTYINQSSELSIKYGNGSWQLIAQANLGDEYFKYTFKDTTATATLKMSIAGSDYISNPFSITQIQDVTVANDCATDFILSWNKLENADSYVLYELQANRLTQVLTTNDTLVSLAKLDYTGNYYAIQPTLANGLEGNKTFTINVENKNAGCYLTNFLVFLDQNDVANIQLNLNVPFQIEEVIISKEFQQSTETFQQFSPGNQSAFLFEDKDLKPGIYYYSTELKINSGETIYSDTLSLFYTDNNTVIAFPNPVQDNFVNILNNYPGGILQLINSKGSVVKAYDLVNIIEPIELTGLEKGVYLFRIIYDDKVVNSGRIVRL